MTVMTNLRAVGLAVAAATGLTLTPTQAAADEPYIGQLVLGGQNFCPRGFAVAEGQLLPISQNSALFSLLGTMYGGDGRTTFGLPDLRGRVPLHVGQRPGGPNRTMGQRGGNETTTLTAQDMPAHNHAFAVPGAFAFADKRGPGDKMLGRLPGTAQGIYQDPPASSDDLRPMVSQITSNKGSGVPMTTQSPYITMKWCVALTGIYPPRS